RGSCGRDPQGERPAREAAPRRFPGLASGRSARRESDDAGRCRLNGDCPCCPSTSAGRTSGRVSNPIEPEPISTVRLGLRANFAQFSLLVVVNFVGAMVGMERSILSPLAESEFHLAARTAILSFILVFGVTKALTNYL